MTKSLLLIVLFIAACLDPSHDLWWITITLGVVALIGLDWFDEYRGLS